MASYAHPQALVSTEWVSQHLNNPQIKLIEVNETDSFYARGHLPGAVEFVCDRDLHDSTMRDVVSNEAFAATCEAKGISNDTTVVLYGHRHNWWACYAFWVFKLFGHQDVRLMDGGREKWMTEGRSQTRDIPQPIRGQYVVRERHDESLRAFRDEVTLAIRNGSAVLVDGRTPEEYSGKLNHMAFYPNEGAVRGGHIPTAINIPWNTSFRDDATFRSYEELSNLYPFNKQGEIIAYCRIGERSGVTWFVLTYLLGYPNVRNYDGGWLEWGNAVQAPIHKQASLEPVPAHP